MSMSASVNLTTEEIARLLVQITTAGAEETRKLLGDVVADAVAAEHAQEQQARAADQAGAKAAGRLREARNQTRGWGDDFGRLHRQIRALDILPPVLGGAGAVGFTAL